MPRDASGNFAFTPSTVAPAVDNTVISATDFNAAMDDIATEMEDSLSRSGKGGMLVPFLNAAGTAANPGISFTDDDTGGIFLDSDEVGVAVSGVEVARFKSTGLTKASLAPLGQQISSSSGNFSSTGLIYTDVTSLTVTITTTGRPVMLMLQPDGTSSTYTPYVIGNGSTNGTMKIVRDASDVAFCTCPLGGNGEPSFFNLLPYIDAPVAGTYTYKIQVVVSGAATTANVLYQKLVAYEL